MNHIEDFRATVLVVESNTAEAELLRDLLQEPGWTVEIAGSAAQGLLRAQSLQPDLILLNFNMPERNGPDICRELKKNPATRNIPILFMIESPTPGEKQEVFRAGGADLLSKPVAREEALARIGAQLALQMLNKALQDKNREVEQLNQNFASVMDRKSRLIARQEKEAVIGRMTQGIVHNLKTPLSVIQASLSVLKIKIEQLKTSSEPVENLEAVLTELANDAEMIGKAYKQIKSIVDTLMLKSRMDREEKPTLIDVNKVLRQEVEFLNANPQFKHKVQKEFDFYPNLPLVRIVYSNLVQVIENLISNALDAMWGKEDQRLILRSYQDEENVYIDVQDNGSGIPEDQLEAIFDPFFTTKPPKGDDEQDHPTGTGLGLHTCLELLKPFGGAVRVRSKIGEGSTFTIVLPKKEPC